MFAYHWSPDTFRLDFESFRHDGIESPSEDECEELAKWMYEYIDEYFFDWACELLSDMRREQQELNAMRTEED